MGNVQFGFSTGRDNKFHDYTILSVTSADPDYPSSNMKNYWSITRACRGTDLVNAFNIYIDLGSAIAPILCLDHVNWTSMSVIGGSTSPPTDYTANVTVSMNPTTRRYKAWVDCTGNPYRYWRIRVPGSSDSPPQSPTGGANYWRIGRLIVLNSAYVTTAGQNIAYGYSQQALSSIVSNQFEDSNSGAREIIYMDDNLRWKGTITWDAQDESNSSDTLWYLNYALQKGLMVFYENRSNTSKFYVCHRDEGVSLDQAVDSYDIISTNSIELVEVI